MTCPAAERLLLKDGTRKSTAKLDSIKVITPEKITVSAFAMIKKYIIVINVI